MCLYLYFHIMRRTLVLGHFLKTLGLGLRPKKLARASCLVFESQMWGSHGWCVSSQAGTYKDDFSLIVAVTSKSSYLCFPRFSFHAFQFSFTRVNCGFLFCFTWLPTWKCQLWMKQAHSVQLDCVLESWSFPFRARERRRGRGWCFYKLFFVLYSGSQPGAGLPSRGHLAMSGGFFGLHSW